MSGAIPSLSAGLSSYYSMKPNNVILQVRDAVKQSDALLWLPPAARQSTPECPSTRPAKSPDKKSKVKDGQKWRWSGYLSDCQLVSGLSWGVTCLMTDCKENQDGWAAQFLGSRGWSPERAAFTASCRAVVTDSPESERSKNTERSKSYEIGSDENYAPALKNAHTSSNGLFTSSSTLASRIGSPSISSSSSGSNLQTSETENQENAPVGNVPGAGNASPPADLSAPEVATKLRISSPVSDLSMGRPSLVFSYGHELSALAQQATNAKSQPKSLCDQDIPGAAADVESATFMVLDGHGIGGRDAAAALERSFDHVFSKYVSNSKPSSASLPASQPPSPASGKRGPLMSVLGLLAESFSLGQKAIEKLNIDQNRDFGTTCVTVSVAEDFLICTSCGDSSAYLFALPADNISKAASCNVKKHHLRASASMSKLKSGTAPSALVIELTRKHSLTDPKELARIEREGQGRVIRGDNNILRLIPRNSGYEEAKRRGLSINMSRSLGHQIFSNFGLSNAVDYSFLPLSSVYKLLDRAAVSELTPCNVFSADHGKKGKSINQHWKLPQMTYEECSALLAAALEKRINEHRDLQKPTILINHSPDSKKCGRTASGSRLFSSCLRRASHDNKDKLLHSYISGVPSSSMSVSLNSEKDSGSKGGNDIRTSVRPHANSEYTCDCTNGQPYCGTGPRGSSDLSEDESAGGFHNNNINKAKIFLLLMSDGITDVIPVSAIGEFIASHDKKCQADNVPFSCASFSYSLATLAKESRRKRYQRADNCTCLCVNLSGAS